MPGLRNLRVVLAAGVAVVAVAVAVAVLPGQGSTPPGDADAPPRVVRAKLTLEQATRPDTGEPELLVSLPGPQLNSLELTGGATVVWLRCRDDAGAVAIRHPWDWPLIEEEGYQPHIHQPADQRLLDSIRSCRLTGPGIEFEARVSGRLPAAG